jgi:hypothetical protein
VKYIKLYEEIDFSDIDNLDMPINIDFEGHEDFYDFLEENGVLDEYISNYYNNKCNTSSISIKKFLDMVDETNYVLNAFGWLCGGSDMSDIWEDLNDKWVELVSKKKSNYK